MLIPRKEGPEAVAGLAGKCFVMFANPEDARKAVKRMNGKQMGDKKLKANLVADVLQPAEEEERPGTAEKKLAPAP